MDAQGDDAVARVLEFFGRVVASGGLLALLHEAVATDPGRLPPIRPWAAFPLMAWKSSAAGAARPSARRRMARARGCSLCASRAAASSSASEETRRSVVCMGALLLEHAHDDLGLASGASSGWTGFSSLFTYPVEVRNVGLGSKTNAVVNPEGGCSTENQRIWREICRVGCGGGC